MKQLTLSEFSDYLKSGNPACFVYSTANQTGIHSALSVMARYPNAKVSLNTMRVMFYGEGGHLCINRVRRVLVDGRNENANTEMMEFVCDRTGKEDKQDRYTIVAGFTA